MRMIILIIKDSISVFLEDEPEGGDLVGVLIPSVGSPDCMLGDPIISFIDNEIAIGLHDQVEFVVFGRDVLSLVKALPSEEKTTQNLI